ncbi:bifunctional phosphoribosyl-AMP cyclohydrolase/phosphoribosyl-ATP diphosphatase HisIE [Polyangium sp. y55x31]|uniref:bifunctional phosphoribosyl-AMP cyclohydrolase/phosphoribosyl-ATP diphosphatase HisIE n=1 Tax=Polyangium sp. y55x31 TaxID=3042688 RepID=UPI0024832093|nr:bifunctional phosphoribosyl-AMP cyclohydrolase/phosphoribosyl-ATP diphosphatase HisIE [Polyangium sp. y55x31]MDI1478620.1 bifunctional phosphoribosyl-AMP cyclohydrolase/phosphoribosyl-ATP diphosphatase HisIE [Polyangium sp. y55x31]
MELAWGEAGLLPAIVQDRLTGQVRMIAYMNRASLERTIETGRATFFSRSRGTLWEKGETSGNTLAVAAIVADCDADALLLLVDPAGPTCHTGKPACFFRRVDEHGIAAESGVDAAAFLEVLEREIEARRTSTAEKSYTRSLLDGGPAKIGAKIREEADELVRAIESEDDSRVANEAADLVYHVLVGLASRGVPMRDVVRVLATRAGTSGHEEKAKRSGPR